MAINAARRRYARIQNTRGIRAANEDAVSQYGKVNVALHAAYKAYADADPLAKREAYAAVDAAGDAVGEAYGVLTTLLGDYETMRLRDKATARRTETVTMVVNV